jgi:hypothetical protein
MMQRLNRSAAPDTKDYGLLVAAATVSGAITARVVRELLHANGIRSTVGPAATSRSGAPTRLHILVFPEDALRAYETLCDNTL